MLAFQARGWELVRHAGPLPSSPDEDDLVALADAVRESRGGRHRSTYSALMMWVAFERAIRIGRQRGMPAPIAHWRGLANSCYQTVQREGWNPGRQAYGQYLGGTRLDASLLMMPLVKFASPIDRRVARCDCKPRRLKP